MFDSDGYNSSEVSYQWTRGRGVFISSDMKLPQFDLLSAPSTNHTLIFNKGEKYIHNHIMT